MEPIAVAFWVVLAGALYSYFLYPLLLASVARREPPETGEPAQWPRVSFVIAAYNEEARIRVKLQETLALDYPEGLREILVASDGSTDGTDEIVREFADRGVQLVRPLERRGKEHAQAEALRHAGGDIVIFSDVATTIGPGSVRAIAKRMADPSVGAVSSEDRFVSADGRLAGEGAYVRYEMWLRRLESRTGGLVGLSGSFFAVRRSVCNEWDTDIPSDFNTALNCARHGLRAVSDPRVIGIYPDIREGRREYQRKLRTVVRGMAALTRRAELLNPFRYGLFAWQVWSHKVMRWAVPWLLLTLLPLSFLAASEGSVYRALLAGQLAFYAIAAAGWASGQLRSNPLIRVVTFFVQANAAVAHAGVAFLMGRRITLWEPSKR